MEVFEINPHIRYAAKKLGGFKVRRSVSICYDARVFYFKNVSGSITVNGEKYNVSNKTGIYLPPLCRYVFNLKFSEESTAFIINFDLVTEYSRFRDSFGTATVGDFEADKAPKYELPMEFSKPIVKQMHKLSSLLNNCIEVFEKGDLFHRERSSAILKLVLLELIDTSNEEHSPLCERILDFVQENYADVAMTNESIAEKLNYHPYYINRVFKSEIGVSLRSYIIDYRLYEAKKMLASDIDNISEVGYRTGFASSSYFTKIFKERVGMTPREYRKSRLRVEL